MNTEALNKTIEMMTPLIMLCIFAFFYKVILEIIKLVKKNRNY